MAQEETHTEAEEGDSEAPQLEEELEKHFCTKMVEHADKMRRKVKNWFTRWTQAEIDRKAAEKKLKEEQEFSTGTKAE